MYMTMLNKYWSSVLQKKKKNNPPKRWIIYKFCSSLPFDAWVLFVARRRVCAHNFAHKNKWGEGNEEQMEPNKKSQGMKKDTTTSKYGTKLWEII